jgi:hypothetical protein
MLCRVLSYDVDRRRFRWQFKAQSSTASVCGIFLEFLFSMTSELAANLDSIRNQLVDIRAEIRLTQQRQRRQQRQPWSDHDIAIAVAVYCLSHYNIDAAKLYLHMRDTSASTDTDILIENEFLKWSIDVIVSMHYPEIERHKRLRSSALHFLAEKSTVEWILDQNSENNFAPTIGETFQHYRQLLGEFAGPETAPRRQRKIINKLRRRWRVSLRGLDGHSDTTQEERQQLVCTSEIILMGRICLRLK